MQQGSIAQEGKEFDVFLCHNSMDKPEVKKLGEELRGHGVVPWLDEWELRPGLPWQRTLEAQLGHIKAAAVFVGKDGIGPWQHMEIDAFLREFVSRGCPVIPVLLQDAPKQPQLPLFLSGMTWVDFRRREPDPIEQLIWGITGVRLNPNAAGDQYVQSMTNVRALTSPAWMANLTPWQHRVLEQKRDDLQKLWETRSRKVQRIKQALTIETDVSTIVKYETQLAQEEAALKSLTKEVEEIEQKLQ